MAAALQLIACTLIPCAFPQVEGDVPQEEVPEITLPSEWETGTRYTIHARKERTEHAGGRLRQQRATTTEITAEVVDRSETGYVVRWTFGATTLEGAGAQLDEGARALLDMNRGMALEFSTDPYGTVQHITNEKETRAALSKALAAIEKLFDERGVPRETTDLALDETRRILAADAFEATLLREPSIFYSLSGGTFALGEDHEYATELPNPFGGESFPAKGHFVLSELKPEEERAILLWGQELDPEKTAEILTRTVQEMARRLGKKPEKDAALPKLQIEDRARYEYDLATGIPTKVEFSRSVVADEVRRVDAFVFEVKRSK